MTKYLFSVNINLNPLINYDTKYNLIHHHSQRFIIRFLVPNPSLVIGHNCLILTMSNSYPFNQQTPAHHIHIFREGLLEYRVCTPSEKWCWKTFLQDGITEHRIFGFVSIIKSASGRPPIIKLYTSKAMIA